MCVIWKGRTKFPKSFFLLHSTKPHILLARLSAQGSVEGDALRAAVTRAGGSRGLCWERAPMPPQNGSQLGTAMFQTKCSPPSSAARAVGEQSSISRTNFGLTRGQERSLELLLFNVQHDTSWLYLVSVSFSCASAM